MQTTLEEEQIQNLFDFRATYDRALIDLSLSLHDSTDRLARGPMAGPERDRELEFIAHLTEQIDHWQTAWGIFSSIRLAGVGEILEEMPRETTKTQPYARTIPELSRQLESLAGSVRELSDLHRPSPVPRSPAGATTPTA